MDKLFDLLFHNRYLLEKYGLCSCVYCLREFDIMRVTEWCDDGMTGVCPYCGVDALLASPRVCTLYSLESILDYHRSYFGARNVFCDEDRYDDKSLRFVDKDADMYSVLKDY